MPRFLVTGTDTGIGKTTVASAIAAAFRLRDCAVGVMKPIETGCAVDSSGELIAADARQLQYFAESSDPLDVICPFRFRAPLAPAVAARRDGIALELSAVADAVERFAATHPLALIEGAGGLLVPLAGRTTFADLARSCALRLLIVVGNRLGALNHAQLTVRCAAAAGLSVAGYVVNTLQPEDDLAARTNVETLAELIGPALGVFPWMGAVVCSPADRLRLAEAAERTIRVGALLA
jgi:dethiobiotin synthetase